MEVKLEELISISEYFNSVEKKFNGSGLYFFITTDTEIMILFNNGLADT